MEETPLKKQQQKPLFTVAVVESGGKHLFFPHNRIFFRKDYFGANLMKLQPLLIIPRSRGNQHFKYQLHYLTTLFGLVQK